MLPAIFLFACLVLATSVRAPPAPSPSPELVALAVLILLIIGITLLVKTTSYTFDAAAGRHRRVRPVVVEELDKRGLGTTLLGGGLSTIG